MSDIYPEGSAIDTLEKFAKETKRTIDAKETPYQSTAVHPVTYHLRKVSIPDTDKKEIFYLSYGNSREYGTYANFSGVFFPINAPLNTVIKVRNRDILDKINPFLSESDFKSDNKNFNKKVVIEENDIFTTQLFFSKTCVQKLIPSIFKHNQALRIGINDVKIDFIEEFKGKSHFGIYILDDWIVKPEEIEFLFEQIKTLKKLLIF